MYGLNCELIVYKLVTNWTILKVRILNSYPMLCRVSLSSDQVMAVQTENAYEVWSVDSLKFWESSGWDVSGGFTFIYFGGREGELSVNQGKEA